MAVKSIYPLNGDSLKNLIKFHLTLSNEFYKNHIYGPEILYEEDESNFVENKLAEIIMQPPINSRQVRISLARM